MPERPVRITTRAISVVMSVAENINQQGVYIAIVITITNRRAIAPTLTNNETKDFH